MSQAERPKNMETQQQQQQNMFVTNDFPRDFLHRFISGSHFSNRFYEGTKEEDEGEDVELSLGLSLNGRFGVDPRAKKLTRTSSIPDFLNPTKENGNAFVMPSMISSTNLARTCSLPTETGEEWRKRKEIQSLRRMEAKRKRSEKQRNFKAVKDKNRGFGGEESWEEDRRENGTVVNFQQKQLVNDVNGSFGANGEVLLVAPPSSQCSNGSQGSGSSGTSESESQPLQGMSKCTEARSPASVQSLSECEQQLRVFPGSLITEKSGSPAGVMFENKRPNKPSVAVNGAKEMARKVLEDMPCVSTTGDGPNGKRIEGFLYRYRKGEEVRIVCVCHGNFLSPAEFVKHAGGGDVAHPLKHIVVNPSPLL